MKKMRALHYTKRALQDKAMTTVFKKVEPLQLDDEMWCVLQDGAVPPVIQIEGLFTYKKAIALLNWLAAATGHYPEREGWKLVPVEPTKEWVDRYMDAMRLGNEANARKHIRAMLSAAPAQPAAAAIQQDGGEAA